MLAIARALLMSPKIMLLDEPSEGLAPVVVEQIGRTISKLRDDGMTVLLVEHNLKVVEGLCDHITVLARGEVLAQGDYDSVSRNPEVQAAYLGTDPTFTEAAHG